MTAREFNAASDPDTEAVKGMLSNRYASSFPEGITQVSDYFNYIDDVRTKRSLGDWKLTEQETNDVIDKASRLVPNMLSDGTFLLVQKRFDSLIRMIRCATPVAVIGFGLFAWAANPVKEESQTAQPPASEPTTTFSNS